MEFFTEEEYAVFYNLLWSEQSESYRDEDAFLSCGRVMTWFPYIIQTINGTAKAVHETTGTELFTKNVWMG